MVGRHARCLWRRRRHLRRRTRSNLFGPGLVLLPEPCGLLPVCDVLHQRLATGPGRLSHVQWVCADGATSAGNSPRHWLGVAGATQYQEIAARRVAVGIGNAYLCRCSGSRGYPAIKEGM
jgi:hypothetical protein